jgi:hypothetical protein
MKFATVLLFCLQWICAEQSFSQELRDFDFASTHQATVTTTYGVVFEALINGKGPFQLIFDTGAGVNVLNPALIAELGLPSESSSAKLPAFGGHVESNAFHADDVQVGGLALHHQTFYSVQMPWPDGKGPVGAVGYEIMRRLVVTVDYEHQNLTFYDPTSFKYQGSGEETTLQQDATQLVVNASVDGAQDDFVVDTGDFNGLDVNQSFVKKFALLDHVPHRYHGVFSRGAGGYEPPEWITRLKTVCIGRACVHRVVAYLSDGQASWDEYAGTIGADILKNFRVTIEWSHHTLYLEKNSKRPKPDIFNRSGILADFDDDGKGLKVAAVLSNSPGEKAGIKVGDRITLIDHQPPANAWGSDEPAFLKPPGTVVSITILRDHAVQEFKIKLKNLV